MLFHRLKNLCKAGAIVIGSVIGTGHITGGIVQATTDNPADFLQKNIKQKLDKDSLSALSANYNVRVVEHGSWQMILYRYTHPLFMMAEHFGLKGNTAYTPTDTMKLLGEKEMLLATSPKAKTILEQALRRPYMGERELQFAYTVAHEVGHHDHHRREGNTYYTIPINERKSIADLFALRSLQPAYGNRVKNLVVSFRAAHLRDNEHDTLPALLHPSASTESKAAVDSYNETAEYISRECFDKKGITYRDIPQSRYIQSLLFLPEASGNAVQSCGHCPPDKRTDAYAPVHSGL